LNGRVDYANMLLMSGLREKFDELLAAGELRPDPVQSHVIDKLQALTDKFAGRHTAPKKGFFKKLISHDDHGGVPRGVYIYGGVGRGKSLIMDLFFDTAPVKRKRRVHFHAFMLECHAMIHEWRGLSASEKDRAGGGDDPIVPMAERIAAGAQLLCFDEFQVSDVADAMILGRLYEQLFALGVTIVSTSNRPPEDLYIGGINRELFLPFIDMIRGNMDILELDGPTDYRLARIKGIDVYHTPVNEASTQKMRDAFFAMTDRNVEDADKVPTAELSVQGRKIFVPKSSKGVAVFSFKRLCANPLGAADFLAIAWAYHTVFIVAIPCMTREQRNEAKRFVTLIDTLYENGVKLVCSAAVEPDGLYPTGDGSFEFSRTASRLYEMQSQAYLARGHAV
jgi:cell division protein ZapE